MTRCLLVLVFCSYLLPLYAQRQCNTTAYTETIKRLFPAEKQERLALEGTDGATAFSISDTTEIIIPVVVHVVYFNDKQNISVQQIQSQLDALNDDFAARCGDFKKLPSYFKSLAANSGIRFVLAGVDPQGAQSTGITRFKTGTRYFKDNDAVKFARSGGVDAWDSRRYLNIWVCDLDLNLMGYATFPGGPAERDGVVIDYRVFGTVGDLQSPYNKGRTATHEIGHWMGLKHLWGDGYCGDDGIDDTPKQQKATRGCPSGEVRSCGTTPNGDMYMNFMDFTDDACMYMFTNGQRAAMRSVFTRDANRIALAQSDVVKATPSIKIPGGSVKGPELSSLVKMYPNPAENNLVIDVTSETVLFNSVQIFNHLGQEVLQRDITRSTSSIQVGALPAGLYFVQLKAKSGEMYRQKILKK